MARFWESIWLRYQRRKGVGLLSLFTPLLYLISGLYGWQTHRSRVATAGMRKQTNGSIPTISIGNLTVGGSGKTPITITLAAALMANGKKVGIVSSGYGRLSRERIAGFGRELQHEPATRIGDELRLMAITLPEVYFAVDRRKIDAVEFLQRQSSCDVILVDDGFQHWPLARQMDIVLLDATMTAQAAQVFPYGTLRESFTALRDADLLIITRSKVGDEKSELVQGALAQLRSDVPVYTSTFEIFECVGQDGRKPLSYLHGRRVFLFAGIASFPSFAAQITSICGTLAGEYEFADHQQYDDTTIRDLSARASHSGGDLLVTTMKDWVKLDPASLPIECVAVDMRVQLSPSMEIMIPEIEKRLHKNVNKPSLT